MPIKNEYHFHRALIGLASRTQAQTRTGKELGLPNDIAYDDGVCDGVNEVGYQLAEILKRYGVLTDDN